VVTVTAKEQAKKKGKSQDDNNKSKLKSKEQAKLPSRGESVDDKSFEAKHQTSLCWLGKPTRQSRFLKTYQL
jgi:hypothetical protein